MARPPPLMYAVSLLGALSGGLAAGFLWVAHGSYFSDTATRCAGAPHSLATSLVAS